MEAKEIIDEFQKNEKNGFELLKKTIKDPETGKDFLDKYFEEVKNLDRSKTEFSQIIYRSLMTFIYYSKTGNLPSVYSRLKECMKGQRKDLEDGLLALFLLRKDLPDEIFEKIPRSYEAITMFFILIISFFGGNKELDWVEKEDVIDILKSDRMKDFMEYQSWTRLRETTRTTLKEVLLKRNILPEELEFME